MNDEAKLAVIKQKFEQLVKMRDPAAISGWEPTQEQRSIYAKLLENILNEIDLIRSSQQRQLLSGGSVGHYVPEGLLEFYRNEVEPRMGILKQAFAVIDPASAEFYELLEGFMAPRGADGGVKTTFEVGIEQVRELINRNPDFDSEFFPDQAAEVLESKLISFDPDSWLDRAGKLTAVRTDKRNFQLPIHARFRLEELYRAYIFGNWLSVLALSRSILEYVIKDNLHKFQIDPSWPTVDGNGKRKKKRLSDLIDEISMYLPQLKDAMHQIREYGNDYLHPEVTRVSKESLLARESAARHAVEILALVVEELYLWKKSGG